MLTMQRVDYLAVAERAMRQIEKGAFLIAQEGDRLNIMTIGWASIGFIWGRPIMTVLVRNSRFTYELLERGTEFSVSVPFVDLQKALTFCGTNSGRKIDKIKKCGLEIFPGQKIKTPLLQFPGLHFECKIVYRSPMDPAALTDAYKHLYPEKDYHTVYFGEIVYCYSTEDERKS
jgi:flavin reductase (DIM6/NTAB) family NADH-FMN oxidoreductase RutF